VVVLVPFLNKPQKMFFYGKVVDIYVKFGVLFYSINRMDLGQKTHFRSVFKHHRNGIGIFGIEAAAQQYFKKSAKNLSRKEAAMIIACLPNPKKFTVVPTSKRVAWRYPQIVQQMAFIEDDEDVLNIIK
jgi:hypothetical protein